LFIAVLAVQLIGQAVPSSIAAGEIVEFTVQVTLFSFCAPKEGVGHGRG
jgi:hypothetical protein